MPSKRPRSNGSTSQADPEHCGHPVVTTRELETYRQRAESFERRCEIFEQETREWDERLRVLAEKWKREEEIEELERERNKRIVEERKQRFAQKNIQMYAEVYPDRTTRVAFIDKDDGVIPKRSEYDIQITYPSYVMDVAYYSEATFRTFLEQFTAASYYNHTEYDTDYDPEEVDDYTPAYKRSRK